MNLLLHDKVILLSLPDGALQTRLVALLTEEGALPELLTLTDLATGAEAAVRRIAGRHERIDGLVASAYCSRLAAAARPWLTLAEGAIVHLVSYPTDRLTQRAYFDFSFDLGEAGIRVNAVHIPLDDKAADELAAMTVFLLSAASGAIHGQVLFV